MDPQALMAALSPRDRMMGQFAQAGIPTGMAHQIDPGGWNALAGRPQDQINLLRNSGYEGPPLTPQFLAAALGGGFAPTQPAPSTPSPGNPVFGQGAFTGLAPGTGPLLNPHLQSSPEVLKMLGALGGPKIDFGFPATRAFGGG